MRVAPMPPGEDVVAAERAAELCSSCDISAKALFVLPHAEHQFGYILRLEHAFHELAMAYYAAEIRRVKSKKELLSKSSHQALLIRCQIKLAMLNELRQDTHTALRHYKLAYQHLTEAVLPDADWHELKVVAAILNFNICRLCFHHNIPIDAITHFRRHCELFAGKVGNRPDVSIARVEQHAWLARQYSLFGEQFETAVHNGLAAIQTQHPGFYFQNAAEHAAIRRNLVVEITRELRSTGAVYPEQNDPLAASDSIEYYGQRPWRIHQSTESSGSGGADVPTFDEHAEAAAALALKVRESHKDLNASVMALYNKAMLQYKRYRCVRMRRRLMAFLAAEYAQQQHYDKALQLYMHVIWEYRAERWWPLVSSLCHPALTCACTLASVTEYVALSLQLLNPTLKTDPNTRSRIAQNLTTLFSGEAPTLEPSCTQKDLAAANWRRILGERCFFMVQMAPMFPAIVARAAFVGHRAPSLAERYIHVHQSLQVHVWVHSQCPTALQFRKLTVALEPSARHPAQTIETPIDRLCLKPNQTNHFVLNVHLSQADVDTDISITSLSLDVGTLQSAVCGSLHWDGSGAPFVHSIPPEYGCLIGEKTLPMSLCVSSSAPDVRVTARPALAKLVVDASPSLLLRDVRVFTIRIENAEKTAISNVQLCMKTRREPLTVPSMDASITESTSPVPNGPPPACEGLLMHVKAANAFLDNMTVACKDLPPGEFATLPVRFSGTELGTYYVDLSVHYDVDAPVDGRDGAPVRCRCVAQLEVKVDVFKPFDVQYRMTTITGEPMDHVICAEPMLLHADISAATESPIVLRSLKWQFASDVEADSSCNGEQHLDAELHAGDCHTSTALITIPEAHAVEMPFGCIAISWRRSTLAHLRTVGVRCSIFTGNMSSFYGHSLNNIAPGYHRKHPMRLYCLEESAPTQRSVVALPSVVVRLCAIVVSASLPTSASVRQAMHCAFTLRNVSNRMHAVTVTLNAADSFMFSGRKQCQLRLLPGASRCLSYVLFPLIAGFVPLPSLQFSPLDDQVVDTPLLDTLNALAQRTVPSNIFVLPIEKRPVESTERRQRTTELAMTSS